MPEEPHKEVHRQALQGCSATRQFLSALGDTLQLTHYFPLRRKGSAYEAIFAKPKRAIADALFIDREVLILVANYPRVEPRTLAVVSELINEHAPRLYPRLSVIVHADPQGDGQIREWAAQKSLTLLPIYAGPESALTPARLETALSREIYGADSFQITGPVANDADFFGRKSQVLEVLRALKVGRIKSIFGLRKVGKTSVINRVALLAREDADLSVAVIDCSVGRFSSASNSEALQLLGATAEKAVKEGYADLHSVRQTLDVSKQPAFFDALQEPTGLLIILDEVDSISPFTAGERWRAQFVEFWRELRALVQEAQRRGGRLSMLISGVSSKPFRVESIAGEENPVLHFVPEEYLGPFTLGAADAMIKTLGTRCGLSFDADSRGLIGDACGWFPFWMRELGSFLHRAVELDARPADLGIDEVQTLVAEFIDSEGVEIAEVALQNLQRIYPEVYFNLVRCWHEGALPIAEAAILLRYGLGVQVGLDVSIRSAFIQAGLQRVESAGDPVGPVGPPSKVRSLQLADSEWAEELASIGQRRNMLERKLREVVRVTLRLAYGRDSWSGIVVAALNDLKRSDVASYSSFVLMDKLYWLELRSIISRAWAEFEPTFGDKRKMHEAMDVVNERPDAHAKPYDLADVALMRQSLDWLEERVLG